MDHLQVLATAILALEEMVERTQVLAAVLDQVVTDNLPLVAVKVEVVL
jgi:hypothetical protein